MSNIFIEKIKQTPIEEQKIEIVERKGLGHPDTICDLIMNEISIKLSKLYLKRFGFILHHNIDKALLAAGEAEHKFGGGEIKKPMLLVIGDRATYLFENEEINVSEVAVSTAKKWFKENMRFVDPEEHVKYQVELKQVSASLAEIFKKKDKILGANDTSAAVGYYPLSRTENVVLNLEKFLNSRKFKKEFPESGEDIKIMGLRIDENLDLTIAMAFVDKLIDSEKTYFERKKEIISSIKDFLNSNFDFKNFEVKINTLDKRGKGVSGLFLTVNGTCADSADSGQVGRGNRVNGVIPLNRPTSSEAAAGKNPVSHIGKIYNILSHKIARKIFENISGIKEVYFWLLSEIGRPINKPKVAMAQVILENEDDFEKVKKEIKMVIEEELQNIDKFCIDLAKGKYAVC